MVAQFVDISQWQPQDIDWQAYKQWSASGDGVSRVAIRSSYGVGYQDTHFAAYRASALATGIDQIIYYHYSYPQSNSAVDEAKWQYDVIGSIRPNDLLVLDFEENVPQATAGWAYEWLAQQEANYGGKLPGLYASSAYITQRLADIRLARFPLWLANWQFTPDERPACPYPWSQYEFVQFTDRASIPGIPGIVDCNIFLGKETPMSGIPTGWSDTGTVLTDPNGGKITGVWRTWILSHQWDAGDVLLKTPSEVDPVEQYYAQVPSGGARADFLYTSLGYTSKRGTYKIGLGHEFEGACTERDKLKAQIVALQAQIATLQQQPGLANLQQINALSAQISTANAKIGTLSQVQ